MIPAFPRIIIISGQMTRMSLLSKFKCSDKCSSLSQCHVPQVVNSDSLASHIGEENCGERGVEAIFVEMQTYDNNGLSPPPLQCNDHVP